MQQTRVRSLGWEDPLEKGSPVFWPGEFHGLYNPWGCKESDMTERLLLYLTAIIVHLNEAPLSCARHNSGHFRYTTANPYRKPPRFKFYLHIQLRKWKVRETLWPQRRNCLFPFNNDNKGSSIKFQRHLTWKSETLHLGWGWSKCCPISNLSNQNLCNPTFSRDVSLGPVAAYG